MKKTISTNDQDGHIFFKLEPNDKETVRMIDKTIQRFPNLSIEGHVTNIDKENGNIEIQLTTPSEHPEIKVAVKLFLEIIKRKNSNKSKKRIRGNTRKRKQLISKNLPNLIKKHGKNAILSHIVDQIEKQENSTVLKYSVEAQIGGKLAQLGSRLIDSTSKKLAGKFFDNFVKIVDGTTQIEEEKNEQKKIT